MDTPLICLFIAMLLPYLARIPAGHAMNRLEGGYDNHHPREQQKKLQGLGLRSDAAHKNSFEALMVFTAALFIAHQRGMDADLLGTLSMAFVAARVAYIGCYFANWATVRSLCWFAGFGLCVGMGVG